MPVVHGPRRRSRRAPRPRGPRAHPSRRKNATRMRMRRNRGDACSAPHHDVGGVPAVGAPACAVGAGSCCDSQSAACDARAASATLRPSGGSEAPRRRRPPPPPAMAARPPASSDMTSGALCVRRMCGRVRPITVSE